MSSSIPQKGPRIQRSRSSIKVIKRRKYRDTLDDLMRDFKGRCAYSCQHWSKSGMTCMEVDHFDPRQKRGLVQNYDNLLLATRHCNLAKGTTWPTKADMEAGLRFLNPCKEADFGVHIFEDPVTHELVGGTAAGEYHILHCDLNAPHFVNEREDRARIIKLLNDSLVTVVNDAAMRTVEVLKEHLSTMIPLHPYLNAK